MNVKKGDTVKIIVGQEKSKTGKVLSVNTSNNRIVVEGLNQITKSVKPKSAQDQGGRIKSEGTIDVSNVMIICGACGNATRIAHSIVKDENGKSVKKRICKKCGAELDAVASKAKAAAKKTAKKTTTKKAASKE